MKFILSTLVILASFVVSATEVRAAESNLATEAAISLNLSSYSNVNVSGGIGFTAGLKQKFYFHEHVGVFAGLDYAKREMTLNDSSKAAWLDIPFGISFRYGGFASGVRNTLDLGLFYGSILTKDSSDAGIGRLQGGLGFYFGGGTYFDITPNFALGLNTAIKYSFFSPFAASNTSKFFSFDIGLGSQFQF